MEDRLIHYGVLGMKWGVRRTPEQLGRHKIKKGTTVYRVTPNKGESSSGTKYVTYLKPDRDMYRGSYLDGIKRQYKLGSKDPMYEKSYKLSKDLIVPSRKELTEVISKLARDKVTREVITNDALTAYSQVQRRNGTYTRKKAEQFIQNFDSMPADELMIQTTRSFGLSSTKSRSLVISELKKRGYNAMVDEAGVGSNKHGREGVEPLIIFDGDNALSERRTRTISDRERKKATERHREWLRTASGYRYRDQVKGEKYPW